MALTRTIKAVACALVGVIAIAVIVLLPASAAHAASRAPKFRLLAGSSRYLAYVEYPVLADGHRDFAHGQLHVLTRSHRDRDLGASVADTAAAPGAGFGFSLVGSMLTASALNGSASVQWWDLASGSSGTGTLPDGASWQGSAPDGWVIVDADHTTLGVESRSGTVTSYGSPLPVNDLLSGTIVAHSGPTGVVTTGSNVSQAVYQPWSDPSQPVALNDGLPVSLTGGIDCDSVSGSIAACTLSSDGQISNVVALPLDGSLARLYPSCGTGSIADGPRLVVVCSSGSTGYPRFVSPGGAVTISPAGVVAAPGVTAFGGWVTESLGRHAIVSLANATSTPSVLVRLPATLAQLDAVDLGLAASAVAAEAVASGALAPQPAGEAPARLLQSASDALIAAARAKDPSLRPTDTRAEMGAVPANLRHHSRHRPPHRHVTVSRSLDRFGHAVTDRGSAGFGTHRKHDGSTPAKFQTADGVYVDPRLPAPSEPTVGMVALHTALSALGQPYIWAAAGPSTFDCSGLMQWAYAHAGVRLTHFSGDQYNEGQLIPPADILPGDLVLFDHLVHGHEVIHHVGMYLGAGWLLNAPYTGQYVDVVPVPTSIAGIVRP